jgi:hypothetical protein
MVILEGIFIFLAVLVVFALLAPVLAMFYEEYVNWIDDIKKRRRM